jgi:hypothetical protein
MKKGYIVGAAMVMMALSGCEEGGKSNTSPKMQGIAISNSVSSADIPNIKVKIWDPQVTTVGTLFNKQANGVSAIWFIMTGEIKSGTKLEIWFGDTKLSDNVVLNEKLLGTSYVPNALLEKEGDYPIYLVHAPSKKRFDLGVFKIKPAPAPLAKSAPPSDTGSVATTKKSSKPKDTKSQ